MICSRSLSPSVLLEQVSVPVHGSECARTQHLGVPWIPVAASMLQQALQVMLSYVDILLLTQSAASKALAAEINAKVQDILSSDAAAVRDIETQVRWRSLLAAVPFKASEAPAEMRF